MSSTNNSTKGTRKLISITPATDSDGSQISLYSYEITKDGKTFTQTVKTRRTPKFKDHKFDLEKDKTSVVQLLVKYFNEYKFENANQLEEFRVLTKDSSKLKTIISHIETTLNVHLTQLELRNLINSEISPKINVKISFSN